jgi:hypothetical protein
MAGHAGSRSTLPSEFLEGGIKLRIAASGIGERGRNNAVRRDPHALQSPPLDMNVGDSENQQTAVIEQKATACKQRSRRPLTRGQAARILP